MSEADRIAELQSGWPDFKCIPGCTQCCGHVPWSEFEFNRLTVQEQDKLRHSFTYNCPFAVSGKGCSVYPRRTLTCRVFGLAPEFKCPQGRVPEHWMSVEKVKRIFKTYIKEFFDGNARRDSE